MTPNDVMGDIVASYMDWQPYLLNLNYCRSGTVIQWNNCQKIMFDEPLRSADVITLQERSQYTYQVGADGGMIQLYYDFSIGEKSLASASLGFYRIDSVPDERDEEQEDEKIQSLNTIGGDTKPNERTVSWMRLDYKPEDSGSVCHGASHLHCGGFRDVRLFVEGVPTPHQFVEFVMASFYQRTYEKHRLDLSRRYSEESFHKIREFNNTSFNIPSNNLNRLITHLQIPNFTLADTVPEAIQTPHQSRRKQPQQRKKK